ncbi:hypothetical protein Ciccas_000985 [Cichlidogyrus casuarinus]|uniref:K Homology domain-containing protein n=1 Tax=Cichlidogyrus casuarinus TaxID=1844966 RepID=A0ABD2QLN1_9PLAT
MKRIAPSGPGPARKNFKSDDTDNEAPRTVRFLVPSRAAGLIIGKGGENIKRIKQQLVQYENSSVMWLNIQ